MNNNFEIIAFLDQFDLSTVIKRAASSYYFGIELISLVIFLSLIYLVENDLRTMKDLFLLDGCL